MRTWQQWKDSQSRPEDWTVPGIAQRDTLDEPDRKPIDAVQESLDRRG